MQSLHVLRQPDGGGAVPRKPPFRKYFSFCRKRRQRNVQKDKMKLAISYLASQVLAEDYNLCFEAGNFLKQGFDNIEIGAVGQSTFTIPDGSIACANNKCTLSCDQGYNYYGGNNVVRCLRKWDYEDQRPELMFNTNIGEVSHLHRETVLLFNHPIPRNEICTTLFSNKSILLNFSKKNLLKTI